MRIAIPIDHLRPGKGGLEAHLTALARHLADRGDEVHSVTMDEAGPGEPFVHHHVRAHGLGRARKDLDFAKEARDLSAREGFDVVLGIRHLLACDVYLPHGGTVAATIAAHRRAKALPSLPSARIRNFFDLERRLLTGPLRPSRVIAVSELVREDLVYRYPAVADSIRVVPNGVDLERYSPEGREAAREKLAPGAGPVVLFLAGNPRLKGWRPARTVFDRLRRGGGWRLLVAGGEPKSLPRGATYLGPLDDPREAFLAADVLLQPTFYDPFPLTTLEALASGTPVVTTRANGAVHHLGEGRSLRVVESPESVDGMTRILAEIVEEAPREEARGKASAFPLADSLAATAAVLDEAAGA